MSSGLLLGIDEGTTAVKAALFDRDLRAVAEARRPVPVSHPSAGRVEQDPELIVAAVVDAVAEVLERADGREVIAAGLDHQGESVLAWDADSARALTPVIVWQDKRQEALLDGIDAGAVERSALPLDPYFSAGKLAWLLANERAVQRARERGTLRLGTVDAFLTDRLGGRFATDLSSASRTQLLASGGRDWDEQLLSAFGIRREWLPTVGPTFGQLGELRHERWPAALALAAQLVDQQAALAGSGAVRPGELKATYGTGRVRARAHRPSRRSAAACCRRSRGPRRTRAAASARWRTRSTGACSRPARCWTGWPSGLGLAADAPALSAAAAGVHDSAGVMVLPALAGVGAPWWLPGARGVIAGLHPGVRPAHIGLAALEAIAWRVADIVEAIARFAPVGEPARRRRPQQRRHAGADPGRRRRSAAERGASRCHGAGSRDARRGRRRRVRERRGRGAAAGARAAGETEH